MYHMEISDSSIETNVDDDNIESLEKQNNHLPYKIIYPEFDLDLDEEFDAVRSMN